MTVFLEILYNLGIIVSISIFSGFIGYRKEKKWINPIFQGLLFGAGAIIGMLAPVIISPGLIFDGRSILISLSGYYYGPAAAIISGVMSAVLRLEQGGIGEVTGVLVISFSVLTGMFFYFIRKDKEKEISIRNLLFFGIIVHLGMVLLMFTLPGEKAIATIQNIAFPVLLFYPLATLVIGKVINLFISQQRTNLALLQSEEKIRSISNNLQEGMIYQILIKQDKTRRFTYLSDSVKTLYGITPEEGMKDSSLIYSKNH